MLILAIEHSTSTGSVALLRDGTTLGESCWNDRTEPGEDVLANVTRLLREAGVELSQIEMLAVGLGPGAYTSLRTSVSTAHGLALPGGRPVHGVSSAEALAWDLARTHGAAAVAVVGDARRGRLWCAQYRVSGQDLTARAPLALVSADDLEPRLTDGETVATPDWDRIGDTLRSSVATTHKLIEHRAVPRAVVVGELVCSGKPAVSVPQSAILYAHPPVFVEPRFPRS